MDYWRDKLIIALVCANILQIASAVAIFDSVLKFQEKQEYFMTEMCEILKEFVTLLGG